MPSPLVNRYAVFVHLQGKGAVRRAIARDPSLMMAVESCLAAYQSTGHFGYVIEDQRQRRAFTLDRNLVLRVLFLKSNDEESYFQILNRLDRTGGQAELVAFLVDHAPI